MHVIKYKPIKKFYEKHPNDKNGLITWFKILEKSNYPNIHELRLTFPSADPVGKYTIFNVGGNNSRVITVIHYNRGKVYIRDILTHSEYDKNKWRNKWG